MRLYFFFSSRRRHTRCGRDWSSDVCSSDLLAHGRLLGQLPDKVRERQIKRRERHQKFWSGLLEDLRAEGRLRADADIHLARIMILGSINSIQSWFNPRKGSLEKVADQICDMFFRGVGPADK